MPGPTHSAQRRPSGPGGQGSCRNPINGCFQWQKQAWTQSFQWHPEPDIARRYAATCPLRLSIRTPATCKQFLSLRTRRAHFDWIPLHVAGCGCCRFVSVLGLVISRCMARCDLGNGSTLNRQELDHRFLPLFPFARASHFGGYPMFDLGARSFPGAGHARSSRRCACLTWVRRPRAPRLGTNAALVSSRRNGDPVDGFLEVQTPQDFKKPWNDSISL